MKQLVVGISLLVVGSAASAQSVTVGVGGDYPDLSSAIAATSASATKPDVITFISEGPFVEPGRIIINNNYALDQIEGEESTPLTIKAEPGIRPRIAVPGGNASAFYLRKIGTLSISDLIIMPAGGANPASHGVVVDDHGGEDTEVTLRNLLITSNDGNNQPVASLDGRTSPTYTENTISFRQDGINCSSMDTNQVHKIYIEDVVISGIPGASNANSCGIRGFCDGAFGSEWIVGPGCVISYLNTNDAEPVDFAATAVAAFQPGDNRGMPMRVLGTEEKPVLVFNNNTNGIGITNGGNVDDGIAELKWVIFANNSGVAYTSGDVSGNTSFENVTIVNNASVTRGSANADENELTFSNVIIAGNGDASDPDNVIRLIADGSPGFGSTFAASDSAIVLNGPYTLNNVDYGGDGIVEDSNWTISNTNIISSDPQFLSLDPESPAFGMIGNQAYATAGPGGQELVGGGSLASSGISDWQLF